MPEEGCNAENVIEKGGNSKAVDLCRSQAVSDRIVDSDPVSGNDSAVLHDKREGHSQEHETSTMQQNGKRKMSQTHPSIIKRTRVPFAKNSKLKIDLKKGEIIEIEEGGSQCD